MLRVGCCYLYCFFVIFFTLTLFLFALSVHNIYIYSLHFFLLFLSSNKIRSGTDRMNMEKRKEKKNLERYGKHTERAFIFNIVTLCLFVHDLFAYFRVSPLLFSFILYFFLILQSALIASIYIQYHRQTFNLLLVLFFV